MTIRRDHDGTVILDGLCPIEDAEALLRLLLDAPQSQVDLALCQHAHTAVIQVLLAARPRLRATSTLAFWQRWLEPALSAT